MDQLRPTAADATPGNGFFIPDLCAPPAVLLAILLAELVVLLHVLALGPLANFDWQTLAVASVFVQWNTLLSIGALCRLRRLLQRMSPFAASSACLAVIAAIAAASSGLVYAVYPLLLADSGGIGDWLVRNVLLALILAAIVLRFAYLQQRVAVQQRSELQLRLDALQARIRPHFLFNTLNSIASLIAVQPERAEQAVEDVAELFRAALHDEAHSSTLAEEQHLCSLYLNMEKLRLGERLQVSWQVDESLLAQPLPSLLLQPLVENAVYHGIAQRPDGGCIEISATRDNGDLLLSVVNPMPERPSRPAGSGHHMALVNIRERLDAQFGDAAELLAERRDDVFLARVRLPVRGVGP